MVFLSELLSFLLESKNCYSAGNKKGGGGEEKRDSGSELHKMYWRIVSNYIKWTLISGDLSTITITFFNRKLFI